MFTSPTDVLLRFVARLNELVYQERAQTLGEYALIVSLVGVAAVIFGLIVFRERMIVGYDSMVNCLNGHCGSG